MNTKRIIVLGLALVAASAAALLARGLFGGGTPRVEAKPVPAIAMSEVLVTNTALQPGQALGADAVHWQKWPTASVDPGFITRNGGANIADLVKGVVVRTSILAGQPITSSAIVHGDAAGFMAAMLSPGMRAVSIPISTDSGAGGFILPNDRIDLILTQKTSEGGAQRVRARTILSNVRVLAVDQTYKQVKDTETVIGKTATLEMTPSNAELVAKAQSQGQLSLSLRPLGDNSTPAPVASAATDDGSENPADTVSVIRYGVAHADASSPQGGAPRGQ